MRNAAIIQTQTNATANLGAITMQEKFSFSVIASFSDIAAAGTLKVQVSNDPPIGFQPEQFSPTVWVDLSGATATVVAGATVIIPKTDSSYQYMRVVWTRSAGAGTFTAKLNVQGI